MNWSFLFNVAVERTEGQSDHVGSKITQKQVFIFGVIAHTLKLDVVVYLVCYFEVIVFGVQLLPFENTLIQNEKLYYHHAVRLQHQSHVTIAEHFGLDAAWRQTLAEKKQWVGFVLTLFSTVVLGVNDDVWVGSWNAIEVDEALG